MKIVIDIPEEKYKLCKRLKSSERNELQEVVANGTPFEKELEDIKAELHKIADDDEYQLMGNYAQGMEDALKIIDKHISDESFEKED